MKPIALLLLAAAVAGAAIGAPIARQLAANSGSTQLPQHLRDTGLYAPDSTTRIRDGNIPFTPQYPLWSDGARKRRWIFLPPGTAIDATRADAWDFPIGTRLWKEFSHDRRVETRYLERLADGSWRYATYVWNADGSDAALAPADGAVVDVPGAPGGRYAIPAQADCGACHEGPAVPVLGFSALQLSPDRDPLAPHAERIGRDHVDLQGLVTSGRLRNLPTVLLATPPRIDAPTPTARAALGYLHGNCGHCHNENGALAGLDLLLAQHADTGAQSSEKTLRSLLGHASRFRPHGSESAQRIARDGSGTNVLTLRMQTDNPFARMPPLGVQVIDVEGVALVERWINHDLSKR